MKQVQLKAKREAAVRRFHPWVFSGAISKADSDIQDGDWVKVCSQRGDVLATGHYQAGSIMVRILSFTAATPTQDFWIQKLKRAFALRQRLGLTSNAATNAYRLVHAEGDGLPGLIIDVYQNVAVVQCHSIGMHRNLPEIEIALRQVFGESLMAIYTKSKDTLPRQYADRIEDGYLFGDADTQQATEYEHRFFVDWAEGQKTGFFLDQRENRRLLASYARGRSVLNTFSYTGGFSIYALAAGATRVCSVDASRRATDLCNQNIALNNLPADQHEAIAADALHYLKEYEDNFDIVIVDPPAFAKSLKKRHNAVQGYKRLNAAALQRVKPGGLLFTFSCSQVVDKALFDNTITAAAIEAGRAVQVLHHLSQGPDHPVSLFHPEGAYLKGLVLAVQ